MRCFEFSFNTAYVRTDTIRVVAATPEDASRILESNVRVTELLEHEADIERPLMPCREVPLEGIISWTTYR